ncbi:MAG: hypothetical protein WCJ35_05885 [Planctomycetota bacterium]
MAKKKSSTTKSSPATKTKKPSAAKDVCEACCDATSKKKPPKKSSPKKHDHHDEHEEEIELDDTERKAVDLVIKSEKLRDALEAEVNTAVTQAVRKICKAHGALLTVDQAQNVAMVLFGD